MIRVGVAILSLTLLGPWPGLAQAQTDDELRRWYFGRDTARIEKLAHTGDARAEAWMGLIHQNAGNRVVAKDWWRKAAEKDNRWAITMLAQMHHRDGENDAAMRWYRRGAELGNPENQYELAWHYARGVIVQRDEREAVRWYRAAAEQKYQHAYLPLARHLANGAGVDRDPVEAYALAGVVERVLTDSDITEIKEAEALKHRLLEELDTAQYERAVQRADQLRWEIKDLLVDRDGSRELFGAFLIALLLLAVTVIFGAVFAVAWLIERTIAWASRRVASAPR